MHAGKRRTGSASWQGRLSGPVHAWLHLAWQARAYLQTTASQLKWLAFKAVEAIDGLQAPQSAPS